MVSEVEGPFIAGGSLEDHWRTTGGVGEFSGVQEPLTTEWLMCPLESSLEPL